jgi:hypothetical protein
MSIPKEQEPKYDVTAAGIVNRQSGEVIPHEEPILILRARDIHAIKTLEFYADQVKNKFHESVIGVRIAHFTNFKMNYPERMKEPDTDKSIEL